MRSTPLFVFLEQCLPLLAVMALIAGCLWAGIAFSVSWLSGRARLMADGADAGRLALSLDRRWGTPCLAACLASTVLWVWSTPGILEARAWLVGLAGLAVTLLVLHASVVGRARSVSEGSLQPTHADGVRRLFLVLSIGALLALVGTPFLRTWM
jgi:hypothetical protein